MKDLTPMDIDVPVVQEISIPVEYRLEGTRYVPRGMKLFSYDIPTGILAEVQRTPIDTVDFNAAKANQKDIAIKKSKAVHNPNAIYLLAINKKNAIKKLIKIETILKTLKQQHNEKSIAENC